MAKQNPTPKPRTTKPAQEPVQADISMPPIVKQIILTLAVTSCMFIIIKLPANKMWWEKVTSYYKEMPEQKKTMDVGKRMEMRHGGNYAIPMAIEKNMKENDIFLLPPKEYILKYEKNPNNWSNPYLFYYMTDKVKTCPYNNDTLRKKATFSAVYQEKGGLSFIKLENDSARAFVDREFSNAIKAAKK